MVITRAMTVVFSITRICASDCPFPARNSATIKLTHYRVVGAGLFPTRVA
jgi:hypothetical protein